MPSLSAAVNVRPWTCVSRSSVAVSGPSLAVNKEHAEKLFEKLKKIPALRDVQFAQSLDYPTIQVDVDREKAGLSGLVPADVSRALVTATSSSRFTVPNYWADPRSGVAYQVQVQIPQSEMTSIQDVEHVPVTLGASSHPLLGDVAQVAYGNVVGEYHRLNGQRMVTLTANTFGEDLGRVSRQIDEAIQRAGELPRGVKVTVRGQVAARDGNFVGDAKRGMFLKREPSHF